MKTKLNLTIIVFIIILPALLLSGCDTSKLKIGEVRLMYGENEDGRMYYDIKTFSGFERGSVQTEKGQTIAFDYDATLTKGSLIIEWQDPEGEVVWRKNLVESDSGVENITVESSGEYTVVVQGLDAGGSFDVSWNIQ
jgi:hypothetical protein